MKEHDDVLNVIVNELSVTIADDAIMESVISKWFEVVEFTHDDYTSGIHQLTYVALDCVWWPDIFSELEDSTDQLDFCLEWSDDETLMLLVKQWVRDYCYKRCGTEVADRVLCYHVLACCL